jgi:hypothetical protein
MLLDGPTTLIVIGLIAALAAYCFTISASSVEQQQLNARV